MVLLIHALCMMEFPHPAVSSILPHLFLQLQRTPLLQNHACSLPSLAEECSATSDGNGETLSFRTPGQPARWLSGQLQHMVILWATAHLTCPLSSYGMPSPATKILHLKRCQSSLLCCDNCGGGILFDRRNDTPVHTSPKYHHNYFRSDFKRFIDCPASLSTFTRKKGGWSPTEAGTQLLSLEKTQGKNRSCVNRLMDCKSHS